PSASPTHHLIFFCRFYAPRASRDLHSFPTRRSSDLEMPVEFRQAFPRKPGRAGQAGSWGYWERHEKHHSSTSSTVWDEVELWCLDRKSTRLNSSHLVISYAVFCLKKKKNTIRFTNID